MKIIYRKHKNFHSNAEDDDHTYTLVIQIVRCGFYQKLINQYFKVKYDLINKARKIEKKKDEMKREKDRQR